MRISDWSSDVCSSDLHGPLAGHTMVRAENRRFPGCFSGAAGEAVDLDRGDPALHMEQAHRRWRRVEPGGLHRLGAGQRDELVDEIGRAHVCTPVTNAHLVCRLLLEKKNIRYKK